MELLNLKTTDLFADAADETEKALGINRDIPIHIRIQQRTTRKKITICEGLPSNIIFSKVIRALRHNFHCNVSLVDDPEHGKVLKMQGNHVQNLVDFLTETRLGLPSQIKIHGI